MTRFERGRLPVGYTRIVSASVQARDGFDCNKSEKRMAAPQIIKIQHQYDYRTNRIGEYAGGNQFMAFVVATLPTPIPKDWRSHKRWYAVRHLFDEQGTYGQKTQAW